MHLNLHNNLIKSNSDIELARRVFGNRGLDNTTIGLLLGMTKVSTAQLTGRVITDYIQLRDEKNQNTNGGTFTTGAWQRRDLNAKNEDTGGHCTLLFNQFTLLAGTYWFCSSAPAVAVARHQSRLQNVTDAVTTLTGTSEYNPTAATTSTKSLISDRFTITGTKTFELQHRCETTSATIGFGVAANFTTEVYSFVQIFREAG